MNRDLRPEVHPHTAAQYSLPTVQCLQKYSQEEEEKAVAPSSHNTSPPPPQRSLAAMKASLHEVLTDNPPSS